MILNFPASKCSEFVCFFLTNFRLVVFIKFVLIKECHCVYIKHGKFVSKVSNTNLINTQCC